MTFVDQRKAYDSVPREGLWKALRKLGIPESVIATIQSFHENGVLRSGKLSDDIKVDNSLRQGCSMSPTLFMLERWREKMKDVEGSGILLNYKMDGKLFRRYTRNAKQAYLTEGQFADDAALLATTHKGAKIAMTEFASTASDFGLSVSFTKTKVMADGRETTEEDESPLSVGSEMVQNVKEFPYLGSVVASSGILGSEIDRRISQASKAFGALKRAVFQDHNLTTHTKHLVYNACVLSVLYGSESWIPLRKHLKMDAFHNRCIRITLGTSRKQQWSQHMTSQEIRERWGDIETMSVKIMKRRLE